MLELSNTDSNAEDALSCFLETISMKIVSTQTLDFTPPWDFHISDEMASFYMVASGRCCLKMDGAEDSLDMSCGDLALLLNKNAHHLQNDLHKCRRLLAGNQTHAPEKAIAPRTTLIRGTFTWAGKDIASFLPEMPPAIHIKFREGRLLPWMSRTIMMIADESAPDKAGGRAVVNHLANVIFIQGIRAHLAAIGGNGGQVLEFMNHRRISPALCLMNAHPEEAWTLALLARKCAMSRSAFAEEFKRAVGQTPIAYLLKRRINRACELLDENILGIKEISEQTGYQSQSAFNNAFKRWSGVAPGFYRKSKQGH